MRSVTKSRNGCARCKKQRLKCDEVQPSCSRCSRVGVQCPGYVKNIRWSTKHEVAPVVAKTEDESTQHQESTPLQALKSPKKANFTRPVETPRAQVEMSSQAESPSMSFFDNQLDWQATGEPFMDPFVNLNDELQKPLLPFASLLQDLIVGNSSVVSGAGNEQRKPPTGAHFLGKDRRITTNKRSIGPVDEGSNKKSKAVVSRLSSASLRRGLNDPTSILIEYYFKDVAGLISCYDSQMNPFRSTVSRLWTSSAAMCRTVQSMAAACLVDEFPQFGRIGLQMRREAMALIEMEAVMDEKALLVLLMLGETASWHDASDLGLPYFNRLKKALDKMPSTGQSSDNNNFLFFQEALIYWEMLLSYVADDTNMVASIAPVAQPSDEIMSQRRPHPWTGVARDTQIALHEVGKLVRRQRKAVRVTSQKEIEKAQAAIRKSEELEERLLSLSYPSEVDIISPGDSETPVWHLLTVAEVYRCTGLIQLYRAFPDLLQKRLLSEEYLNTSGLQHDDAVNRNSRNDWLTNLAMTTLNLLKSLPIESKTRTLTPFLLVASSSELRIPLNADMDLDLGGEATTSPETKEILRMRKFIVDRLMFLMGIFAPKPIRVCLELVQLVWAKMDTGDRNVFWMDVMDENGWETTMG